MRPILFCFLMGLSVIDGALASPSITTVTYSASQAPRHAWKNPFRLSNWLPAPTAPQSTGTGLTAWYFSNGTLAGSPMLTRVDPVIDFQWGAGPPAVALPKDYFSVRWEGLLEAPATGSYTFDVRSENSVRLWVNGKKVFDTWTKKAAASPAKALINLAAGEKTSLKLEFYAGEGDASIQLQWLPPGQALQVIPTANLYPVGSSTTPAPVAISQQPVTTPPKEPAPRTAPKPTVAPVAATPVAGAASTAPAAQAPPSATSAAGAAAPVALVAGVYTLNARANNTPLEVADESQPAAAAGESHTTAPQWEIQDAGEGYYRLLVQGGRKVLEVLGSATSNGAPMNLWRYYSGNNQLWRIEPVGNGYYKLIAKHSRKALTAKAPAEGGIQQWRYNGREEQQWKLQPATTAAPAPPAASVLPSIGANRMSVYPNPSNGVVQLAYQLPGEVPLGWVLYDQRGVAVRVSDYRRQTAGPHNQTLDFVGLPAGDYNLHLTVGTVTTKQPLLIRRPKADLPEPQAVK